MEEKKPSEQKKKNPLQKLKEGLDDQQEQLQVLSTFVRLGVVVWSGFILTLNYVTIPGLGEQERIDPTFIASVFTGALASFGLETAKKRGDGTYKADEEKKKAQGVGYDNGVPFTVVRFETPVKFVADKPEISKPINKKNDSNTDKLT